MGVLIDWFLIHQHHHHHMRPVHHYRHRHHLRRLDIQHYLEERLTVHLQQKSLMK